MIPSSKCDEEAVLALQNAPDNEVLKNAEVLLEWLQDCNWPVFGGVATKLSNYGLELQAPIENILRGTDSIWKANIMGHLIPKFSQEAQIKYSEILKELLYQAQKNYYEEGLIDYVEIQLSRISKIT